MNRQICTALESGVLAHLLQSCSVGELFLAIERVRHGKRYLCHAVAHCVAHCVANRVTHVPLTPREMDVTFGASQLPAICNRVNFVLVMHTSDLYHRHVQ